MNVGHPLIGRTLVLNNKTWTIMGNADWGNYFVLESNGETIIRPVGTVTRTLEILDADADATR